MAYRGDLMACEVDFDEIKQHGAIPVKFFLNGSMVGQATMKQFAADKDALPYPYIGMQSKGTRVLVKVCDSKLNRSNDRPNYQKVYSLLYRRTKSLRSRGNLTDDIYMITDSKLYRIIISVTKKIF